VKDSFIFDVDTRAEPAGDHQFRAELSDRWAALGVAVNGGYLLATGLQALRQVVPFPHLLVASGFFLSPGSPGPARLQTEVVRTGRRMATGEVGLYQEEREVIRVLATFTDLTGGGNRTLLLNQRPNLPPPEDCIDLGADPAMPALSIVDRFEYRMPQPLGWMRGEPSGSPHMEFWMRFRDGRPADPLSLALMVDAAAPAVLEIGQFFSATIELTVHIRGVPASGWLACRAYSRHVHGGYFEEDFEIWDSSGSLVAQSRQLALSRNPSP
jgi:acyl-CoA thioesterase